MFASIETPLASSEKYATIMGQVIVDTEMAVETYICSNTGTHSTSYRLMSRMT